VSKWNEQKQEPQPDQGYGQYFDPTTDFDKIMDKNDDSRLSQDDSDLLHEFFSDSGQIPSSHLTRYNTPTDDDTTSLANEQHCVSKQDHQNRQHEFQLKMDQMRVNAQQREQQLLLQAQLRKHLQTQSVESIRHSYQAPFFCANEQEFGSDTWKLRYQVLPLLVG
jgi:hypothetical protein